MSGIMSVTGLPGQGPVRVGVAVTDIMAGAFLAQGILSRCSIAKFRAKAAGCRPR
jgi:crotonobetainyl-CoA:carnitine CoA-transferase CaiB-like acyl-CoA transferase